MRRMVLALIVAVILIGAGFISISLSQQSGGATPPGIYVQTSNPDANVLVATPQKGALFFGLVILTIGIIGGMAIVLRLVMSLVSREIVRADKAPNQPFSFSLSATDSNSLGTVLTRRPAVTFGVTVGAVVVIALVVALLGVFSPG